LWATETAETTNAVAAANIAVERIMNLTPKTRIEISA